MLANLPTSDVLDAPAASLAGIGAPLGWLVVAAAVALACACVWPPIARWRRPALATTAGLLVAGELLLAWYHFRLWQLMAVVDPATGAVTGHVAASPWIESEKLYVWAIAVGVMALLARRHRDELAPLAGVALALLALGAVLVGRPFTAPLPDLAASYRGYLAGMAAGGQAAVQAFSQMEGARQGYYNAWYMWVHPPLLFLSYGVFVMSFCAALLAAVILAIVWDLRR